jgi:cell division protein FtsX
MTQAASESQWGSILIVIAVAIVLLVPAGQCWFTNRDIEVAAHQQDETKQENANLEKEINGLQNLKLQELLKANKGVDQLQQRLNHNRELSKASEVAQRKLTLAKELTKDYEHILREFDELKSKYPELTSGR